MTSLNNVSNDRKYIDPSALFEKDILSILSFSIDFKENVSRTFDFVGHQCNTSTWLLVSWVVCLVIA